MTVENLTSTLNTLLKRKFIEPLRNAGEAAENKKGKAFSIPFGDCIKIEYAEEGEVIGFLIRPKLATLVFLKDRADISNLV